MSLLYPGRIDRLEIGLTAVINTDIDNVVLMNWERNHDVRPRLYANLKYPQTYQQPHSWILGSFSCLSDNHDAVYATDVSAVAGNQYAMVPNGDSNVIDFFQVTYQDEDGNARVTRFFYALIYRFNKELLNYDDSVWVYHFIAGYAIDAEETPLEYDLISSDADNASIYLHVGITNTISTSFSTPENSPRGITLDSGGNLISVGDTDDSVFIHVGVTSTISTSFSTPGSDPRGATITAGGNLITSDSTLNSFYLHVGVTSTISTSFSGPGAYPGNQPWDLTLDDDENLIHCDVISRSIYIHVGITSTISTSFSAPAVNPTGLTYNGELISASANNDSIYVHSGITNVVSTSFSSPSSSPQGLTLIG